MYKNYTKKRGVPNRHMTKLWLVMRLSIILLIASFMQVAGAGFAQNISLAKTNAPLKKVFWEIKSQSGFNFLYTENLLKIANPVSINVKGMPLEAVLKQIFDKQPLSYDIESKTVIIRLKSESNVTASPKLFVVDIDVKGTVLDETGRPLPGATIKLKSGGKTTSSNQQGQFSLSNIDENAILLVSYTGYISQEIGLNGKKTINVVLKEDLGKLSEVVVVGYGVQKRANLTGAVATISEADIKNRVVGTAAGALQGADPSLNLTFGSGVLDAGYKIDIRGVASVNGGSPLVLADGIEVSLSQINPNDIASVTILKDASASAIYGAKASSGVILITTKKGKNLDGKAQLSYTGRMGVSQNTTSTDYIHNGYDHVNLVNQFYEIYQGAKMALYTDDDLQMLLDRKNDKTEQPERPWTITKSDNKYYYYGNFDWYNYFYNDTRPQKEHNVSVVGGNENLNYFVSGRAWSQDGVFNIYKDRLNNYSFRANLEARIKPWLKYTGVSSFNSSNYKYAGYKDEQQTIYALQSNILSSFLPRNPDGSVVQYTNQLNANSPIGAGHGGFLTADEARNSRASKNIVISNQLDASATKDIVFTMAHAYKSQNKLNRYRNMPFEYSRALNSKQIFTSGTIYDYYEESNSRLDDHNLNVYGTFKHSWNDKHNFTFVAGGQYEDFRQATLVVNKKDLLSKELSSFGVATGESIISQDINTFRTLGFFGRANYDYKGKYLLEVSGRWDGTSRFAPDSRWGFFPSASAGWRMSEESFWEPLKGFWSNSKLRLSVGSLGNQQVGYYSYIDQINPSNTMAYTFDGTSTAYYASVSNPISSSLTWETVTSYDAGLDLSFLDNHLNLTADYYIRKTTDMLTPSLTLPSVYGANTPTANAADFRTNGWEVYLSYNNSFSLMDKPFKYNIGVSLGDYKTTITKYNNPDKLISDYYEGMALGEIWGYRVKGLFATDADAAAYQARVNDKAVNNRVYGSKKDNKLLAGDVEFIDIDGNSIVNQGSGTVNDSGDMQVIGNALPRYSYSFRLGADWNGFDISAFFQGVGKQTWFPSSTAYDFWGPYSFPSLSFIHTDFLTNSWTEQNQDAYFPRARGYATYSSGALGVANDRYLQDVSYLRLKNLTIGYTLPINKKWFDKVRVYASGENLFYWSKLKKYSKTVDPELTNTTGTYGANGGVGYAYSKTYSFGLDITF
jgi:TonB-linked SusC/RagA family outer membrane protein